MVDPVSAVFFALDRGVLKLSDRAFKSAAAKDGEAAQQSTSQEELLQQVDAGQADANTPEVREAIDSELVERGADGRPKLTPLGKYLAPESDEDDGTQKDVAEPVEQQAQVAHS